MKVVINTCYGGFSISPLAIYEIAKRKGKECYFFEESFTSNELIPITLKEATNFFSVCAYSVPNPQDYKLNEPDEDGTYTEANKRSELISLESRPDDRSDKDLVEVVEKLGAEANGKYAELKVIEIPDNIEYQIEEYDGMEWIAEKHRTWS